MNFQTPSYDVIGIGFGPSNLAIAIALEEHQQANEAPLSCCFIEKQPAFEWHGGMLLDNTHLQVSFLKDLVTLRNPSSRYSFINYLHQQRRLESFINLGTFFPSRLEYNDYMQWVATAFKDRVHYGEEVIAVEPLEENGKVEWLQVVSRLKEGAIEHRYARNVIIGIGGYPRIPEVFKSQKHPRIIHSSQYKKCHYRFSRAGEKPRLAVIGAGQSAAEIFRDLMGRYPQGRIDLISRSRALQPSDDSPFVNEIFDPDFTDEIYRTPREQRQSFLRAFSHTNYSVVDLPLIEEIYERLYMQRITGDVRHRYFPSCLIQAVSSSEERLQITLFNKNTGEHKEVEYDGIVLATGYQRDGHHKLLEGLEPWMVSRTVERSYQLPMASGCRARVFLQGCCEETHGIADSLLSVLAVRSKEVVDSLYMPNELKAPLENTG